MSGILRTVEKIQSMYKEVEWYDNPEEYEYLRESEVMACAKNYKPFKGPRYKVIGKALVHVEKYDVPLYTWVVWWLKDYDRGMPIANMDDSEGLGYGLMPERMPSEAVKFIRGNENIHELKSDK